MNEYPRAPLLQYNSPKAYPVESYTPSTTQQEKNEPWKLFYKRMMDEMFKANPNISYTSMMQLKDHT